MIDIEAYHPQYKGHLAKWRKMRNTSSGEEAVKSAGERYLPKPAGMNTNEYDAYKERAMFYGGTGRTIEGMNGLMFRIPVSYNDKDRENYGGLYGTTFDDIVQMTATEVLTTGRAGVLVDYPEEGTKSLTVAEKEKLGVYPYAIIYDAEQIINWHIDKRGRLTDVLLEYKVIEKGQYKLERKHLELKKGRYVVSFYRPETTKKGKESRFVLYDTQIPLMNGETMTSIPFTFINSNSLHSDAKKPPLLDLANVNISMYRNSADYEHGLHWVGLPTPIFKGAGNTELCIGSATGINLPQDGDAFMLEFTGAGLKQISDSMIDKRSDMATLGSRMLATEKKTVETAETASIHRAGESASLQTVANTVSRGLTVVLQTIARWDGRTDWAEYVVKINTDYNPMKIEAPTITALLMAVQAGRLAQEDFIKALQDGEIVDRNRKPEEILQESQDELEMIGGTMPEGIEL
jgi:hypothetical protein